MKTKLSIEYRDLNKDKIKYYRCVTCGMKHLRIKSLLVSEIFYNVELVCATCGSKLTWTGRLNKGISVITQINKVLKTIKIGFN